MLPTSPPPPPPSPPSTRRTGGTILLAAVLAGVLLITGLAVIALRDGGDKAGPTTATTAPSNSLLPSTVPGQTTTTQAIPANQKRVFDQIMAQVSELRGLQWKGPLNLRVVSKEDLARLVREVTARDADPNQIAAEEATLKVMGLIPADTDYRKVIEDLLAGQVLGFYDPETRELFVGGDGSGDLSVATRFTIAHEMTHALTDQVFNFGPATVALDKADKSEESAAYSALLEGDAVLLQDLWADKYLSANQKLEALLGGGGGDPSALLRAPQYIRDSLYFPYDAGAKFVKGLYDAGGYAAVDAAYRKPPTSTEHILHPETYMAGQTWAPPGLPNVAAATGCTGLRTGTVGQFDMRALLDIHLPAADAGKAAEGWSGDAFSVVRCGTNLGIADRWQTDGAADATRLTDAINRWAAQWSGSGKAPATDGRFTGPKGAGRVVRVDNRVDLVLAQDADTMEKVVRALA